MQGNVPSPREFVSARLPIIIIIDLGSGRGVRPRKTAGPNLKIQKKGSVVQITRDHDPQKGECASEISDN